MRKLALLFVLLLATSPASANNLFAGGVASNPPTVAFDFRTGVLDSRLTYTRSGSYWCWDVAGNLHEFTADQLPICYDRATHAVLGFPSFPYTNHLFLNSASPADQDITVTNGKTYIFSFYGTGSVTLSNACSGTLAGTGTLDRVWTQVAMSGTTCHIAITGTITEPDLQIQGGNSLYQPSPYAPVGTAAIATQQSSIATTSISWFNTTTGGTALTQVYLKETYGAGYPALFSFNGGGTTNEIYINHASTSHTATPSANISNAGSSSGSLLSATSNYNAVNRYILAWGTETSSASANGSAIATVTKTVPLGSVTTLNIGTRGGGASPCSCYIQFFNYWNKREADTIIINQSTVH